MWNAKAFRRRSPRAPGDAIGTETAPSSAPLDQDGPVILPKQSEGRSITQARGPPVRQSGASAAPDAPGRPLATDPHKGRRGGDLEISSSRTTTFHLHSSPRKPWLSVRSCPESTLLFRPSSNLTQRTSVCHGSPMLSSWHVGRSLISFCHATQTCKCWAHMPSASSRLV